MLRRGAFAALLTVICVAAPALAQEFPGGLETGTWRQVSLRGVEPSDCLEIFQRDHLIRLSLADLRAMAVDAGRVMEKGTEPRLQRIFELRAQGLLGRVAGWSRQGDCTRAPALEVEDGYVVAELMTMGRAAVRGPGAAREADTLWIRTAMLAQLDPRLAPIADPAPNPSTRTGVILFHVERGGPSFFMITWWVSS